MKTGGHAGGSGTTGPFSFFAKAVDEHAWWFGNADGKYGKLAAREPIAFGLLDMHGNVLEWCVDAFTEDGCAQLESGKRVEAERRRGGH